MDRFLVRVRGVKVDQLGDLRLDGFERGAARRLRAKIAHDDAAAAMLVGGSERLERRIDPSTGGLREIDIAIDTVRDTPAAERFQPRIQRPADGAELAIGGIPEGQHAELDAIEARRALPHQFPVGSPSACRRIAFTPRRGDDNESTYRSQ